MTILEDIDVFPAYAGMSPIPRAARVTLYGFLRLRGDEPQGLAWVGGGGWFSPRERG